MRYDNNGPIEVGEVGSKTDRPGMKDYVFVCVEYTKWYSDVQILYPETDKSDGFRW